DTFSLRGVYKSTDGATWTSASSGLPANPSIRNLAIRGTKLWVYLGGQGLFRSTDGAASWQNVTTGLSGDLFGKVFAASTVLIASAGGVVYRSTDDGDTWAATTGYAVSKFGIEILSMAEDAAGALYLGDEHAGLSVSKDAGVTWAPSSNGLATSNVCIERINSLLFKGGKIYAGQGEGGGVRVSSPIGAAAPGDSVACTTDKDIFPNNFSFTAQTNVKPSTLVKSNIITVAGLGNGVSVPISVSGGEFAKSATCGAGFTTTTGHVVNGDQVCVRHTSAATSETSVKTRLTIGDKSATFTSSTGLVFTGRTDEINTGFGSNGFASVASQTTASDVKILADGSFVSAAATSGFPADIAITKFNYDGSVDTSFGVGGVAKFDAGGSESVVAVIAQSSGKLVAVANTRIGTPSATNKIVLVRFNADGSIDSGFGTSGMVTFDLNPNQSGNGENASSAIALSDGSILIGGGVAITGTGTHFFVVKFSADGVQDTSFGTANATLGSTFADVQVGSSTVVGGALAVQSDGKVLMSGQADVGFNTIRGLVVRFTSAGVLDSGFGSSGKFASASAIALPALLVLGDGSIMAAGQTTSSPFSPVMTRLTSSGALDTSFGSSGVLTLTLSGNSSSGSLSSLLLLANGGIAFSGQAYQSDLGASALLFGILNSNGTLDTSFGNNHGYLVRRPVNGSNVLGGRMAQRADGGVLFGGLYGSSLGAFVFGGTSGPPPDTTPNAFTFATKTAVSRNVQVTSAAKAIKGINAPAPVTISGGTYSIGTTDCGNTYTSAAGMISNGQKICLRHTSSRSPATKTSTIVTIGGVSGTFSSVTVDDVPAAFKFTDAAGVTPSSVVVSDTVTVSGIDAPAAVSVKNGEYSIGISDCGNTFTSADGTISNGQMICVRHTAAAGNNKAINTVLIIGGVQDTFSSVTAKGTGTADVMPNFFHFPDVNNAAPSTLTASQALTIAGIANGSTAVVKVTGGEYSIDGGAFTSADGTIGSGQTIAVRLTSSANASTPVSATLNISGLTDAFTVTTGK
ncbi:MAG TPA: hypothetical protein VHE37_12135, partial [Nevskiaceae bacterium]|nr:hypothetical protein [Nevskiaceae bacterium]